MFECTQTFSLIRALSLNIDWKGERGRRRTRTKKADSETSVIFKYRSILAENIVKYFLKCSIKEPILLSEKISTCYNAFRKLTRK
jgi:hypothetical protein